MTKSELIARLAARYPQLVAKDAELAVKMILDAMTRSLTQGQRIEIRGFGSFGLNYRPPRVGRNPKSGEKVKVPAKHVPHFKAGKELRERVDARRPESVIVRAVETAQLRGHPICIRCFAEGVVRRAVVAAHVHHPQDDPMLFFDISNLQSFCRAHSRNFPSRRNPKLRSPFSNRLSCPTANTRLLR